MIPAIKDFFRFNIGHVCVIVSLIFSVGVSWARFDAKITAAEDHVTAVQNGAVMQMSSLKAAADAADKVISERYELRADANAGRITKLEQQNSDINQLATTAAVLATQVKNLQDTCKELSAEIRALRDSRGLNRETGN